MNKLPALHIVGATLLATTLTPSAPLVAQTPFEGEVRQLVTFRFLPGRSADALQIYTEEAIPLYQAVSAMRSFRGLREVESPVPLDLVVVSSFDGMGGMDRSNQELRAWAAEAGTSIGAIYGSIGALSTSHDDQFVEMLPALGQGDPLAERLVGLVWYRTLPGAQSRFERALEEVAAWEVENGIVASTGRVILSDGWTHLRFLGFESLEAYQSYWEGVRQESGFDRLDEMTAHRRQVILAPVPELAVR
jgi:hypothetical protein